MRWLILALLLTTPAQAETVEIKWNAGNQIKSSEPWLVTDGGGYINGWSKNFMDGTVEERRKVAAEGVLKAEIIKPKSSKGPTRRGCLTSAVAVGTRYTPRSAPNQVIVYKQTRHAWAHGSNPSRRGYGYL